MKFDLDTAWKDATGLLSRNLGLLAVIAGVFFFLPNAGIMVGLPEMEALQKAQATGDVDIMMAAVSDLYLGYWWLFLILAIIQGIGLLAMLALLQRRANPTVGEALTTGTRSVVSYIVAQLIQSIGLVIVATLLFGVGAAMGLPLLAALGGVLAFVVICYIATKLSLIAPIIAIEGELHPLRALRRSWALTSKNSIRLFAFYALLVIAFVVLSAVLSLVLGLVFALAGEQAALLGEAIVSGLVNAAMIVAMVCVLAAVHTQLGRLKGSAASPPVADQD